MRGAHLEGQKGMGESRAEAVEEMRGQDRERLTRLVMRLQPLLYHNGIAYLVLHAEDTDCVD